jgi:hypothetical protein
MDPSTLFNNAYSLSDIDAVTLFNDYVPNPPLPFLNSSSLGAEGTWGIYKFQFANQTDSITINNAGSLVTVPSENTEGWATTILLLNGCSQCWKIKNSSDTELYRTVGLGRL